MEEKVFNMFDEKGNLKPKKEILEEISKIYEKVEKECDEEEKASFLNDITDKDNHIDVAETLETFYFCERALYLTTEITSELSCNIVDAITFWNKVDEIDGVPAKERQPIKIYIDCPGGSLTATFSIIDIIKMSKTPIYTIVTGTAYSGGFFVALSGHKRLCFKNSSFVFHEGSSKQPRMDAHKLVESIDFYKRQLERLKKIVLANTKITEEFYDKHSKDDLWLDAEEAIKYSVVDEIITEIV